MCQDPALHSPICRCSVMNVYALHWLFFAPIHVVAVHVQVRVSIYCRSDTSSNFSYGYAGETALAFACAGMRASGTKTLISGLSARVPVSGWNSRLDPR